MKIVIKVRYDGAAFCGSQVQPGVPTVQGVLTEAARTVFGFDCDVTGCSRTDAGVHALSYIATVAPRERRDDGWCSVPVGKIHRAFNAVLPESIAVAGAAEIDDSFHPRYDVLEKRYIYKIRDGVVRDPFLVGRAWQINRRLTDDRLAIMRRAAEKIVGRHDFACFMAAGSSVGSTVRTVTRAEVARTSPDTVEISVSADGFLYNMVRIITGTLVDAAFGRIDPETVLDVIESKDRTRAGQTAPAAGLYLADVDYGRKIDFEAE